MSTLKIEHIANIANSGPDISIDTSGHLNIVNGSLQMGGTTMLDTSDTTLKNVSKIGIGTASPGYKLHLHENSSSESYQLFTNSTTGATTSDGFRIGIDSNENALIWHREAKIIQFATSNDTKMVILANGNVGIGTTSPSTKLHVDGGGSHVELRVAQNSTYYTDIGINHIDVAGNDLRIMMGGSEKWRFKSGGDLYASGVQEVKSGNKSSIGYEAFFGANSLRFNRDGDSYIDTRGTNNNLKFRHNSSYDIAMTILGSNGNVGIGVTNPGTKLQVAGTQNTPSGTSKGMLLVRADGSTHGLQMGVLGSAPWGSWIQAQDNNISSPYPLTLQPGGGDVGIGTTSPTAKLHIQRAVYGGYNALLLENTNANAGVLNFVDLQMLAGGSTGKVILRMENSSASGATDGELAIHTTSGGTTTERMRIDNNGNVGIGASSISSGFKTEINHSGKTYGIKLTDGSGRNIRFGAGDCEISSSGSNFDIRTTDLRHLIFRTNNVPRMQIHADGHIGFGDNVINDSAWSTVFGARSQWDTKGVVAATDGSMQIGHNWYYDGGGTTGYKYIASGKANRQIHVDDYISWEMEETAGTAGDEITFTERMRLTKDGNLGINVGSNNPSDKLVVVAGGTGILVARNWSGNVTSGSGLGEIGFKGYASGNSTLASDAKITGVADGNHSGTSAPARLEFYVKHPTTGPGSAPTRRMQLSSYGELLLEDGATGWASFYMNEQAGIRYHVKRFYANASNVTWNVLRVKRHYWGSGFYKLTAKQQYYSSISEQEFYLTGHGRNDGSYNASYNLSYQNVYNGTSSRMQITTPSTSAPGNSAAAYVDVQIVVPAYHHYVVVIEAGGMSGFSHDVSSMSGNDMYALHG